LKSEALHQGFLASGKSDFQGLKNSFSKLGVLNDFLSQFQEGKAQIRNKKQFYCIEFSLKVCEIGLKL
jgi:hypothetical protein